MAGRCPHCSFNPTSGNDFCAEHKPISYAELQAAVDRMDWACKEGHGINDSEWAMIYRAMRMRGLVT